MTQSSQLTHQVVSAEEMKRLVHESAIEQKIASSTQQRTRQPQDPYHEQFCCRKELIVLIDNSGDEIAQFIEQVHANSAKGTTRTFTRIRIGNVIHNLRLP